MIAYENSNELCITLPAEDELKPGMFCTINDDGVVFEADGGSGFIGCVKTVKNGLASVVVRGIIRAKHEGGVHAGWMSFGVDDGVLSHTDSGTSVLVLAATPGDCVFLL